MDLHRYRVQYAYTDDDGHCSLIRRVDATSADEASTMVERSFAGVADVEIISVQRITC